MARLDQETLDRLKKPVKGMHVHTRRADKTARLREAYLEVDARDLGICWVTGIYTLPTSPDPKLRREHNHLRGRRVRPDYREKAERIITVTAFVHGLITSGALEVEGDDARKPIFFHWNRKVIKPGKEPIRIRARGDRELSA